MINGGIIWSIICTETEINLCEIQLTSRGKIWEQINLKGYCQIGKLKLHHIPKFNNEGELAKPCGSAYPNQPSDPSTQQRRGNIGLFPIEWDGNCRLELQGKACVCKPTKNSKKTESTPKEKPVVTEVTQVDTEEQFCNLV